MITGRRPPHMALVILLLLLCNKSCAVTLPQPAAIAAEVGSSVNLSCHLNLGTELASEKYLYWYMPTSKEDEEWFVYPHVSPEIPTKINNLSKWRANPKHSTDMSLTIADVRLMYTGTYVCHMSLRINSEKILKSGNGTYLLVHESLDTHINDSNIICRTKVQEVNDVSLIWELEGRQKGNFSDQFLQNSYEISNEFWMGDAQCRRRRKVTVVCLLQYKGSTLTAKSIEAPCLGHPERQHPVWLFGSVIGSSLLILLLVLIIFCVRKQKNKEQDSLYTNIENK
ncbi:uncharacterized protein [Pyxicephalus adspersus]|uniref:uncharacterized protein n=1 Tax=Pyxicephalus adspersus TaxID=30357 RepID=UPI003B5CEED1